MNRPSWPFLLLGCPVFATAALIASDARAFALKVQPIPITMTNGAMSTMAELSNEGSEVVRVQAQAFDWSQSPSGEDVLTPSSDILVFPSMVSIKGGETRKVRVGTQGGYGPTERSFRIVFVEIPADSTPSEGGQEVVKMLARVSVPIFVQPPGARGVPQVEGLVATKDHLRFAVRNQGSAHALVERIQIETSGADDKPLGTADVAGWYVLPGQSRPFDVDLASAHLKCAGAKTLTVRAISRQSGRAAATIERPACATP